jgi:hypothetical protein
MNREAVLANVRRYRAIASLYRQTAAFRAGQSWSLLGEAKDWERRALAELEFYFESIAGTMQHFPDMQLPTGDVRSLG